MQATLPHSQRLSDQTNTLVEIYLVAFTVLPFLLLAYSYPFLSDRVPLFMTFTGEVSVWGEKTWLSVFRVPLIALVTQVFILLTKFGALQTEVALPVDNTGYNVELYKHSARLSAGFWDWLRCIAALKMCGETLDTIFLSIERLKFLSRPTFITTLVVALLSIPVALYYGYRWFILRRKIKEAFGNVETQKPIDASHVYGSVFYFDRSDSALFVSKHLFNFGNVWTWVFIGCIVAYVLLVFLPG